jgi:GTP cyclohydrolase I
MTKSTTQLKSPLVPSRQQALDAVRVLIAYIGDDPDRPGLQKTPERVIKAWEQDWGQGYNIDYFTKQQDSILNGKFDDGAENYNQMIIVKDIRFVSHCEHHLAEFSGKIHVGYIPAQKGPLSEGGPILGLSKLVRVVDMYSKRLQVQERLTQQVADFINRNCRPIGVGVVAEATHSCMCSRGVRQYQTVAVTSALHGEMLNHIEVRSEFLRLIGK